MEGGSLFNPGFLGGEFLWWVGQIADDATWRDNMLSGKYVDRDNGAGWGRRYKVRIIGIHDKSEESVPSDQLPWANIMYPITAGGGQTNAWQSPQLRQGNFVFGFFMDGPDKQVPVIMGILGNNPQTKLKTGIGKNDSNFAGTSGYAKSNDPPPELAIPKANDRDLVVKKPKSEEAQQECASLSSDLTLNKFGLRADRPQTGAQFKDSQNARAAAEAAGLSGKDLEDKVREAVQAGMESRCKAANSPLSTVHPGAAIESASTAPHIQAASDFKKHAEYLVRIPLVKPDNKADSATRAIQTVSDNLSVKVADYLASINDYGAAVSSSVTDIEPFVERASKEMAKYEKINVDKLFEFSLKSLNAKVAPTVSNLPSSQRFQYSEIKEGMTVKMAKEYLEITDGLADNILGLLTEKLDIKNKEKALRDNPPDEDTHPSAPMCYAEEIVGQTVANKKKKIEDMNKNILDSMNLFLNDATQALAGVSDALGNMKNQIGPIEASVSQAMQFNNQPPKAFDFQAVPNQAVADFFTMVKGGGAQPDSMTPSMSNIGKIANAGAEKLLGGIQIPFAEPSKDLASIDLQTNIVHKLGDLAAEQTDGFLSKVQEAGGVLTSQEISRYLS